METIEEAAKNYAEDEIKNRGNKNDKLICMIDFSAGANWMAERMYSEVFEWLSSKDYLSDKMEFIQKEFEQLKKK